MSDNLCQCTNRSLHGGRRVVLTGGPGAGKTAILEVLHHQLCAHVVVLPEAASIVFGGGFPRRASPAAKKASQLAIYHVGDQLEAMACADEVPALVLCDRGVLDGLAYWPGEEAEFWELTGTSRVAAFARYDLVIHLAVPPADGGYNNQNPIRTETPAEALAIDARIALAWHGHPNVVTVENTVDFRTKLERALDLIEQQVPPCCRLKLVRPATA
jgi:predicted ATPase